MGLHCLCAAPHQEIGLTAMQGPYDIIQLLRLRFRHLVALRKKKVGNYHYGVLRLGNTIDLWEHLFGDKLC